VSEAVQFEALMPQSCSLALETFPELLGIFLGHEADTLEIEQSGLVLCQQDFASQELVQEFVRRVCGWGNYPGIAGRVLRNNSPEQIAVSLHGAAMALHSQNPDVGTALQRINALFGLGQVSFASKHLRFLSPKLCPVLDSIISARMFYPQGIGGYQRFAGWCQMVAGILTAENIDHPAVCRQGRWYAADVEASLYTYLVGWR
jgi:hypothetical protein